MIVPMVSMIIARRLNEDVWLSFQSRDCTHGPMWQNYVFTIEHTQKNSEPTYGQQDFESSTCMSQYAP
jgi:hypothetical protein